MAKGNEVRAGPSITEEVAREVAKLTELFSDVEPAKAKLVEGLISDAAFLKVQNDQLKRLLEASGMVLVHPANPSMQKPVEAARQYLKNANAYAVVIKTLNGVLSKNVIDPDDGLDEFA